MGTPFCRKPFLENPVSSRNCLRGALVFVLVAVLAFSVFAGTAVAYGQALVQPQVSSQPTSVSQIYQNVQDSVVVITNVQPTATLFGQAYSLVQGSGFVYDYNGTMVIITNYHVIYQGANISVTFQNGNGYGATVLGSDPYADLAVLSVNAPADEYSPIEIASSSSLSVGDFVAALGSPFGLSGSITAGIVSQLGRTITETTAGNYPIANVIQTDAPINPGNSGGPLLNGDGQVVGINTAGVSGSTGVGFAIPSGTILREIDDLISTGTYTQHPYLGISGVDVNYDLANQTGLSVTYGVLLQQVISGGPADQAGLKAGTTQAVIDGANVIVGGDVIVAINGSRIINSDGMSAYLEENTLPNQTITVTVLRNGQTTDVPVVLGTRPPPVGATSPLPSPLNSSMLPNVTETTVVAAFVALIAGTCLSVGVSSWRFRRVVPEEDEEASLDLQ
jgi:S1-C subfamily serine protease